MSITLLNVGPTGKPSQGEAILIHTIDGKTILIDGGLDATSLAQELVTSLPFWQRSIDTEILTSPRQDHLTGAQDVISRFQVDDALMMRLVAPHFSMLLLGSAALSKYALSGLLTTIDPGFLKANIVQVVGEVGKAFPTELNHILQVASPSLLLITPAALSSKLSKVATTSTILPSQFVVGSRQVIQTAQAGSTTISSATNGWNVNTE